MANLNQFKFNITKNKSKIAVIGLGYVGLPVAYFFSKKFNVVGFDKDKKRIQSLKKYRDQNNTFSKKELKKNKIIFSGNYYDMKNCDIFIITTPTPINEKKKPNLKFIFEALNSIVKVGLQNKIVILESTVFPGASEGIFIKYLEKKTKLSINKDFFYGYSPERINPGDKTNKFNNITKIVSGSNSMVCNLLFQLYSKVVNKVCKSSSILSAETSKLIENSQRDLNVAFVNEIAIICDKLKIKSSEALNLASTKWNFLNFKPGLVGGHCIGVDPYYLFYASKKLGYNPKTLLAGRNLNEMFSRFLVRKFLTYFKKKKLNILIMGATYKANCNDLRNSKTFDMYSELKKKNCLVDIFDPHIKLSRYKNIKFITKPFKRYYDGIIIPVEHNYFKKMGIKNILRLGKKNSKVFDIKGLFSEDKNVLHV